MLWCGAGFESRLRTERLDQDQVQGPGHCHETRAWAAILARRAWKFVFSLRGPEVVEV